MSATSTLSSSRRAASATSVPNTAGSSRPATASIISAAFRLVSRTSKCRTPWRAPPASSARPRTSSVLPAMLPVIEALTRMKRPCRSASRVMISSAALPKVALSRPPHWAPRCSATWPVAWPMSPASGTSPTHAAANTSTSETPAARPRIASGPNTSSAYSHAGTLVRGYPVASHPTDLQLSAERRSLPMPSQDLDQLAINTIRTLSIDAVQKANSGHPGLPLGAAPMAYVLWTRFLRHNPRNPKWPDRDRFAFSAGHGSMLLYSLLYLTGYDLSLDEIKNFRQWGSKTPGHPENVLTPGVEITTGPLGQGFANGVGMAMGAAHLASRFNQKDFSLVDHYIYAIVSDGDLMEGVASEAASLAGHLKLGKLIYLYDDNRVTIEGFTDLAFSESVPGRFEDFGWHTTTVDAGNDLPAFAAAFRDAISIGDQPSLISVKTTIGYGMPTAGTRKAHSDPPGEDAVRETKRHLGWPADKQFFVPDEALAHFREATDRGAQFEDQWSELVSKYEA